MRDNNKNFIRIGRFQSEIDILRSHLSCMRRLTILGHDGSVNPFIVQHPAARHCRREERIIQLFRILNSILERKKETRSRNISYYLPTIIPLAPQIRLVQNDSSFATLQEIFEKHCAAHNLHKDVAIMYYTDRLKEAVTSSDVKKTKMEQIAVKSEILDQMTKKFMPKTILSNVSNITHFLINVVYDQKCRFFF